jgi:hypothetical protein
MTTIILGVFVFAVAATRITRYMGFERWQVSAGLLFLGVVLYFVNISLVQIFIRKHAPEYNSLDEVSPGTQAWELTAGRGIVPRWVSWIGLWSLSALITAILPWVIGAIRWVF